MRYKNYINSHSKSNRIYSRDEVLDMPLRKIRDNKLELESQYRSIGVPTTESLRFSEIVVWVEEYIRDDGTKVSGHWRSKPDGSNIADPMRSIVPQDNGSTWEMNMTGDAADGNSSENPIQSILSTIMEILRLNSQDSSNNVEEGALTGGAADVKDTINNAIKNSIPGVKLGEDLYNYFKGMNRNGEAGWEQKNNDEFFEKESQEVQNGLIKFNHEQNANRPDAKLFMDIALVHPKRVPSCQDYQFIPSTHNAELNQAFQLEGNKTIPDEYDGFIFSANSPTAQRLNNSEEFKSQILREDNYDSATGQFKRDKLEIEFKEDKNLFYSFGHMTILNPKITKEGYVEGCAYDKYNFDLIDKYKNDYNGTIINNSAWSLQTILHLRNYYVLVPIRIKI